MRKYPFQLFVISFIAVSLSVNAQNIAVNTTGAAPVNSSVLFDLSNNLTNGTAGFLAPYAALTANNVAAPIVAPSAGLIVYNTATAGAFPNNVIPGYYYWNGFTWELILSGSASQGPWNILGNAGTTPSVAAIGAAITGASNFIGTTDNKDLVFALNNGVNTLERMRIKSANGNIGIANIAPTTMVQIGNAATTVGKLSIFSQDNAFGQFQVGNPLSNGEASMQFISGVTAFGNPPTSTNGNAALWNIGVGSYGTGGTRFNLADFNFGIVASWTSTGLLGLGLNNVNPQQNLSVLNGVNIDQANTNAGTITNAGQDENLHFGSGSGEGIGSNRVNSGGYELYGLQFYTGSALAMNITNMISGTQPGQVSVMNGLNVDQVGVNNGFLDNNLVTGNGISFGLNSGEGVASKRTAGGNQFGLDFYTGFINRMVIRQTGQVGIGTLVPAQFLEVAPTTSTIRIDGLKTGNAYNSTVTATTSNMLYTNNTTGDIYALPTVNSAILVTSATGVPSWSTGVANGINWSLTGNTGTTAPTSAINAIVNNNYIGTNNGGPDFVMAANGFERIRIQAATGFVGVNITNPAAPMEVSYTGDVPFLQLNTTSGGNKRTRINFSQNGAVGMEIGTDYYVTNLTDLYIYNRATGSTAAYFNPGNDIWLSARSNNADFYMTNGNVGIGTAAPACPLDIETSVSLTSGAGYSSYIKAAAAITTAGLGGGFCTCTGGPWVLPANLPIGFHATTTNNYSLKTSANILCGGEVDVTSDKRLKNFVDNITPEYALTQVLKLNPLHFTWRDSVSTDNSLKAGFFAQEIEVVIPEAVAIVPTKHLKDQRVLDYNMLIPYTVGAIQRQQQIIDSNKAEIAILKAENEALKQANNSQTAKLNAIEGNLTTVNQALLKNQEDMEALKVQLGLMPAPKNAKTASAQSANKN